VIAVVTPVVTETPRPLAALEPDDFARVVPSHDEWPRARRRSDPAETTTNPRRNHDDR